MKTFVAALVLLTAPVAACAAADEPTDPTERCGQVTESSFAIHSAELPAKWADIQTYGVDFTGDGKIDNAIGRAAVTMRLLAPDYNPTAVTDAHLAAGGWRLRLSRCTDTGEVAVRIGNDAGEGAPAVGTYLNEQTLIADGGEATIPMTWIADAMGTQVDAGWLTGARVSLRLTDRPSSSGRQLDGRIALVVDSVAIRAAIIDPVVDFLNSAVDATTRAGLDSDGDGLVEAEEILTGRQFMSLFEPDTTLADDGHGRNLPGMALAGSSFGFAIVADELTD